MKVLSPSLLSIDFFDIKTQMNILKSCGITHLHLDVMDGMYVPSISFGMPVIKSLRQYTDMVFDVHMMVNDADRYIVDMKNSGADIVSVHIEAVTHIDRTIKHIKSLGMKAGVVLNPDTSLCVLDYILDDVDMVLLMSVNPGFGGQTYIPYVTKKIKDLYEIRKIRKLNFDIQVDGGININTIDSVVKAGADNVVVGSALFAGDIRKNILDLQKYL